MRHAKVLLFTLLAGLALPAFAATAPVKLYRNPNCGCCNVYADYLRSNGFTVELINSLDMASVNEKFGVPAALEGCHTATLENYVFAGLVPVELVHRVLSERRPIRGITLPGMPTGAPGMPGLKKGPLHVYYLSATSPPRVFASF